MNRVKITEGPGGASKTISLNVSRARGDISNQDMRKDLIRSFEQSRIEKQLESSKIVTMQSFMEQEEDEEKEMGKQANKFDYSL